MIPVNFEYKRAGSVEEALSLLSQSEDAKILAGGHSLLPAMKLRLNAPATLIDIGRITALRYIRDGGDHMAIGAATTHGDLTDASVLPDELALMSQTANVIGDPQVRNMGTIGGSIAHADPAADWPAALLATNASIVLTSTGGSRTVAAGDFFQGLYMTALQDGEIITEIRVPKPAKHAKSAYAKFMQPASRFAIVGCAVVLNMQGNSCESASVAFTGVAGSAFRDATVENALAGNKLDDATISAATSQAAQGVDLMGDHFASEDYRKHLAGVYAKRAIQAALG